MLRKLHPKRTTGMGLPAFCQMLPRTNNIVPPWTSIFQKWVSWEFNMFYPKINKQISLSTKKFRKCFLPNLLLKNSKACQHVKGSKKSCIKKPVWRSYSRQRRPSPRSWAESTIPGILQEGNNSIHRTSESPTEMSACTQTPNV